MYNTTGLKKVALGLLVLSAGLFARYDEGIKYYQDGEFNKAFPIIVKEAEKGDNKAAEYRLAEMYEKGQGTDADIKKAMFWYKKAAVKYSFVAKPSKPIAKSTFSERLGAQIGNRELHEGNEYALSKMDIKTPETKALVSKIIDGDFFGIKPYHTNFILPVSWSKDKPNRVSPTSLTQAAGFEEYGEHIEVKYQLSLKKDLSYNLFGFNEYIALAYTQEVWWQLYDESGPFRETNYRPEIYITLPSSESLDDSLGLKAWKVGFLHESNGQEGYRSRSWNRLYLTGLFQWDNLFVKARAWYRISEDEKSAAYYAGQLTPEEVQAESSGDDNPDISDFLGYGDINIGYLYGKHKFNLMLRNNLDFDKNRGGYEFNYSYPLFGSPNSSWYLQVFNGYGESLIDYNNNVTKASFGFSFTTGVFQ